MSNLALTFECKMAMECAVCLQFITIEGIKEASRKTRLVGSARYAVCNSCGQLVDDFERDSGYRQRYDARYFQRSTKGRVLAHVG